MIDAGLAPVLPRMGPGFILRVLSKRTRAVLAGPVAPLTSRFTLPRLDLAHVARYRAALGFTADAVPLTYWYLPVQRAHMATLLSSAFPYRLAGIVHVENALIAHVSAPAAAPIVLATRIDVLPPSASGAVYCALETVGSAGGERIFTCTSKYLAVRGARSGQPKGQRPAAAAGAVIDSWTLGPSSGRDYARVSGDWNPIHLTRWSARLMGLPAPIIHGMHSVARTCAALDARAGRQVAALSVRFTAPVPLGEAVVLKEGDAADSYVLFCAGVPAASGTFAFGAG
nr:MULTISPECIES: MaoC/PaaZ C-terminal domain-containing protein [unclassified Massilia]